VDNWGSFGDCSLSCHGDGTGGNATHTRAILQHPFNGGLECLPTTEDQPCNENVYCPIDCVVSEWGGYGECSKACNPANSSAGVETRFRNVTASANFGGKPCPSLYSTLECNTHACPVDCVVDDWGSFGDCSLSCHGDGTGGNATHTRAILDHPLNGGLECPDTTEDQPCNENVYCPVDCVVSAWTDHGLCSQACKTANLPAGISQAVRTVKTPANYGGKPCPALYDDVICNTHPCPVDCQVGDWGDFSGCSQSCGAGATMYHIRAIIVVPVNGGQDCPVTREDQTCNENVDCPVDCVVSDWSDYGLCTAACKAVGVDFGQKQRVRTVEAPSMYGGLACPALNQQSVCNTHPCPIDCETGGWSAFGDCSQSCGDGGTQTQTREITQAAVNGGQACPATAQTLACNENIDCPVDCVVSDWGLWGVCTEMCASEDRVGEKQRLRTIVTGAMYGGASCSALYEYDVCNNFPCPQPCVVSVWSSWGVCDAACGGGKMSRTRDIYIAANYGGAECPLVLEEQQCNNNICPYDCIVSDYTAQGECTKTCGGGTSLRSRIVTQPSGYGGLACPPLVEYSDCSTQVCPQPCLVSVWSTWGTCTAYCAGGTQTRTRTIEQYAIGDGDSCPPLSAERACNTHDCPPCDDNGDDAVDCQLSSWTEWTQCTVTCGGGTQQHTRNVVVQQRCQGAGCDTLSETRACSTQPCEIPCVLSDWTNFGACSATCTEFGEDSGTHTRTRTVTQEALYGADECAHLSETQACELSNCPIDCEVSAWPDEYGECDIVCGGGLKYRTRSVLVQQAFFGKDCPALSESVGCNTHPCPIPCVMSDWGSFSDCTLSCGTGSQTRERNITTAPLYGGTLCLNLTHSEPCNEDECPVDCVMSEWGYWGTCSKVCESGVHYRTRSVESEAGYGGLVCGPQTASQACNTQICEPCEVDSAIDCTMTPFGEYTTCSKSCGRGTKRRFRDIVEPSSCGGTLCGAIEETLECGIDECPVDCELSAWSAWTACTHGCKCHEEGSQEGNKMRLREVTEPAAFGGVACGPQTEEMACNTHACPIDCEVSIWEEVGECSAECGEGVQHMLRNVTTEPLFGGVACPVEAAQVPCNTHDCGSDCIVSAWGGWGSCSLECGGGQQQQTRFILSANSSVGAPCPDLVDMRSCNTECCAVDCVTSGWSAYDTCDQPCGTGQMRIMRHIETEAQCGGVACPALVNTTVACNRQRCPIDCDLSEWSEWGVCSTVCGADSGVQTRSRHVLTSAIREGSACPPLEMTRACTLTAEGVAGGQDCAYSDWSSWKTCSAACGSGEQQRSRLITAPANCGGAACPELSESQACNTHACDVDCTVSDYGIWGACSHTCGPQGTYSRHRTVVTQQVGFGFACPNLQEAIRCNEEACPRDCEVSSWSSWGMCSRPCHNPNVLGEQIRTRNVLSEAAHAGEPCPELTETQDCATADDSSLCPEDCMVSEWAAWSNCSMPCGGGEAERERTVLTAPAHGGTQCPPLVEQAACNIQRCATDCVLGAWTNWGTCSVATCGGGTHVRTRDVLVPTNNGCKCGALVERRDCNAALCPVHCQVSDWTEWSPCDTGNATCGNGLRHRSRAIDRPTVGIGRYCPQLNESAVCKDFDCPIHCLNEWLPYGDCTKTCGSGVQTRYPLIIQLSLFGGTDCPSHDTRHCNSQLCPTEPGTPYPTPYPSLFPTPFPTPYHHELPQPVLTLEGPGFLTLEANLTAMYEDSGASCHEFEDGQGEPIDDIQADGDLFPDQSLVGTYNLTYTCQNRYGRLASPLDRVVIVRDTTCPVCVMEAGFAVVEASFPYSDPGISCTDNMDGNLTASDMSNVTEFWPPTTAADVESTPVVVDNVNVEQVGTYTVTYRARDNSGNFNDATHCAGTAADRTYVRTVTVQDSLKPVLNLKYHRPGMPTQHIHGPDSPEDMELAAKHDFDPLTQTGTQRRLLVGRWESQLGRTAGSKEKARSRKLLFGGAAALALAALAVAALAIRRRGGDGAESNAPQARRDSPPRRESVRKVSMNEAQYDDEEDTDLVHM
jgi:hypothetical protein